MNNIDLVGYVLANLAGIGVTFLIALLATWACFIEALEVCEFCCSPSRPEGWVEIPTGPATCFFAASVITSIVSVLIVQFLVGNILDALRDSGLINF